MLFKSEFHFFEIPLFSINPLFMKSLFAYIHVHVYICTCTCVCMYYVCSAMCMYMYSVYYMVLTTDVHCSQYYSESLLIMVMMVAWMQLSVSLYVLYTCSTTHSTYTSTYMYIHTVHTHMCTCTYTHAVLME